jgi:hypothetical protein
LVSSPRVNYLTQTLKKIEDSIAMETDKLLKEESQNYQTSRDIVRDLHY